MNILTIVGARPQLIKAAPLSKALRESGHHEFLVHTGQHYDYGMSRIFFEELPIPEAYVNLGVGSGSDAPRKFGNRKVDSLGKVCVGVLERYCVGGLLC